MDWLGVVVFLWRIVLAWWIARNWEGVERSSWIAWNSRGVKDFGIDSEDFNWSAEKLIDCVDFYRHLKRDASGIPFLLVFSFAFFHIKRRSFWPYSIWLQWTFLLLLISMNSMHSRHRLSSLIEGISALAIGYGFIDKYEPVWIDSQ